jgi:hypothetical protein
MVVSGCLRLFAPQRPVHAAGYREHHTTVEATLGHFPRRLGVNDSHGSHDHRPPGTASGLGARSGYGSRLYTGLAEEPRRSLPLIDPALLDILISSAYFGNRVG